MMVYPLSVNEGRAVACVVLLGWTLAVAALLSLVWLSVEGSW